MKPGFAKTIEPGAQSEAQVKEDYCKQFANYGHCKLGKTCVNSHDLDVILDIQQGSDKPPASKEPVSKKRRLADSKVNFETSHSACFDAYMTLVVAMNQKKRHETLEHANKLNLMGKNVPLRVQKTPLSKYGSGHIDRMIMLEKEGYIEVQKL